MSLLARAVHRRKVSKAWLHFASWAIRLLEALADKALSLQA